MTPATAAKRYARALFDVALRQNGNLDRIGEELNDFASLLTGNAALTAIVSNPAVPAAKKRAMIDALLAQAGAVSDPVARTLQLLADRDRLPLLPQLARAYSERLMDHRQIVRAEVTTAVPLEADRADALAKALGVATGRHVIIEPKVDRAILGGVVARVGSVIYDGSVARQLEKMKEQLVESGE